MIRWIEARRESESALREACALLGTAVHPVAIQHLSDCSLDHRLPFPRLERHEGYLFGVVWIPSDTANPKGDLDRVVFVATHDNVVAAVTAHPTSRIDWEQRCDALQDVDEGDSTPDGGQFLWKLFEMVVSDLSVDALNMLETLRSEVQWAAGSIDLTLPVEELFARREMSHHHRREVLKRFRSMAPVLAAVNGEVPAIQRVVAETLQILEKVIDNDARADLQTDRTGARRELFSRDLEISLMDTYAKCRRVNGVIQEISATLQATRDFMRQLSDEETVAAGRFTGAIASIMLLPTFIVGLYGQNFAKMPETQWEFGYLFSWGAIVVLTIFQIRFFQRRGWLGRFRFRRTTFDVSPAP